MSDISRLSVSLSSFGRVGGSPTRGLDRAAACVKLPLTNSIAATECIKGDYGMTFETVHFAGQSGLYRYTKRDSSPKVFPQHCSMADHHVSWSHLHVPWGNDRNRALEPFYLL